MIITHILHVVGTKTDLYSSLFFAKVEGTRDAINPFERWVDGDLFGYGTYEDQMGDARCAINLRTAKTPCGLTGSGDDPLAQMSEELTAVEDEAKHYLVENPLVPPALVYNDETFRENDPLLMNFWLGAYEKYPKIYSVDQEKTIKASFGSYDEPNMLGDYAYRHALPDATFDFTTNLVNRETTLPICNGFCCFPKVKDGRIYATQGMRLSYNEKDRNRRWILVDFAPIGGCTFHPLKDLDGTIGMFKLPESFDKTKQSVLLVVDGRLFLPGEFTVTDTHLLFDPSSFLPIYELDRKVCRFDFVYNTRMIKTSTRDLKNSENSFVILINNPNLQVVQHETLSSTRQQRELARGVDSLVNTASFDFSQNARGLLFDKSTRSVTDYVREEQTMTFYADKFRKWGISNVSIHHQTLMAITCENLYNLMSARGFMLDDIHAVKYETIMWPKFVILDLVFRG